MEFNSHFKDVKDKFIRSSVNLSAIMLSCEKIINGISQEEIDELAAAVELFDKDYIEMKNSINKLIVESFEDSKEIDAVKTEDGFEL
jgi:hypothetical protein